MVIGCLLIFNLEQKSSPLAFPRAPSLEAEALNRSSFSTLSLSKQKLHVHFS